MVTCDAIVWRFGMWCIGVCVVLHDHVCSWMWVFFFFQAEDGIRDLVRSRGLGDVYKRQAYSGHIPSLSMHCGWFRDHLTGRI